MEKNKAEKEKLCGQKSFTEKTVFEQKDGIFQNLLIQNSCQAGQCFQQNIKDTEKG